MSLIPTWPFVAGALVVGLAGGFAVEHTRLGAKIDRMNADWAEEQRQREVVRADEERAARASEQKITEAAGLKLQEKENEKVRIAAERDIAVASLRARPDRKPAYSSATAPAAPACTGTTGAELSRPDAEFLVGEAARADVLRAALAQCYGQYDAAREVINASPQQ